MVRTIESLEEIDVRTVAPRWQIDEVLIIDNDDAASAREAVQRAVARPHRFPIRYVHEPEPGLAAARNRALDEAAGRVLVFIDDDEVAGERWPEGLLDTMANTGAALVGGPVRTSFIDPAPAWIVDLFERPEPPDASPQSWLRSGNLAIDLGQVRAQAIRFDPDFAFTGGEDVAFSRLARQHGLDLRWSSDAIVHEFVGGDRTTIGWVTRRERTSTANWVRVELSHDPSLGRQCLVGARGIARLAQGLATATGGLLTLHAGRIARGLVTSARGIGSFQGLLGGRPAASYRPASGHGDGG